MRLTRREALGLVAAGPLAGAVRKNLNVLFIGVDDLRPELGCYGHRTVRSPNIDRLAARSLVLDRAYCQQAAGGPSRASLLTGLRPDTTRVWDNSTHFRDHLPRAVTIPQHFMRNDYVAEGYGKIFPDQAPDPPSWSLPQWPDGGRQAGMQYVDLRRLAEIRRLYPRRPLTKLRIPTLTWRKRSSWQAPNVPDNVLQDGQCAEQVVEALGRLRRRRFFLAAGFQKPHLPFTVPKKYHDLYDRAEIETAANASRPEGAPDAAFTDWEELRGYTDIPREGPLPEGKVLELVHGYLAAISYMDAQVGKVLAELDRLGLRERTVIILWGDHGYHLGEQDQWCKATDFELDTRCPLILSVPGMKTDGYRTRELVELVDIYPTLAEICGLPLRPELEGLSMVPLVEDPLRPWKTAAFSQLRRPWPGKGAWELMGYSVRTRTHRYTEWRAPDGTVTARELYDHRLDGAEMVNVAGEKDNAELVQELGAVIQAGWRAALPPGAAG